MDWAVGAFLDQLSDLGDVIYPLLGGSVPLAQFGYSSWKKRGLQHRRSTLETRIIALNNVIAALGRDQEKTLAELCEIEKAQAVSDLLTVVRALAERDGLRVRRKSQLWRRWLFLPPPNSVRGWMVRALYFVLLFTIIVPSLRLATGTSYLPARILLPAIAAAAVGAATISIRLNLLSGSPPPRG
jgi:hypothetical protein